MTKRILAIDYGKARIGLALSDPTQTLASPLATIKAAQTPTETIQAILAKVENYDIEAIVLGLPLLLSGKESATTKAVHDFCRVTSGKKWTFCFLARRKAHFQRS